MQLIIGIDVNRPDDLSLRSAMCPGCGLFLTTVKEQDDRVHVMLHPPHAECRWSDQALRVDRLSGYAESWPSVTKEEVKVLCAPTTEDEIPTSTTTSAKTPCTTSRSVTRRTPRGTRAAEPGRIRLYREPE